MKKTILALSSAVILSTLTGCGIVGGAAIATGAVVSAVHDRRSAGRIIDDKNLEAKIAAVLFADGYTRDYSHTNLTIFNGVVLVTGEAATGEIRNRIIAKIKTVPKIKKLKSDIAIAPKSSLLSRSNDAAITSKVKLALFSLKIPNFDSSLVNVSTERGKVYILGLVTRQEASAITNKARTVSGVKSVTKVFEYLN